MDGDVKVYNLFEACSFRAFAHGIFFFFKAHTGQHLHNVLYHRTVGSIQVEHAHLRQEEAHVEKDEPGRDGRYSADDM